MCCGERKARVLDGYSDRNLDKRNLCDFPFLKFYTYYLSHTDLQFFLSTEGFVIIQKRLGGKMYFYVNNIQ